MIKKLKASKGFTLIELLIVIALLGALAVGLLAAVDPFEQLKKGRDTSTRNTAAEFFNAAIRYYAQRGAFPWEVSSGGGLSPSPNFVSTLDQLGSAITEMGKAGELKEDFYELAGTGNLKKIYLHFPQTEKLVVCFKPESKSFRNDQNTKYNVSGGIKSGCPSPDRDDCYYCFK